MKREIPVSWFLQLRRLAFVGQLGVFLLAVFLGGVALPLASILVVLLLIPLLELVYRLSSRGNRQSRGALGILILADTFILTLLLYLSGGPTNPFSIAYLVQVVLAAVLLGSAWSWLLTCFSSLCFGALFFWHTNIPQFSHAHMDSGLSLHLQGMFLSYLVVAILVAYFLNKILSELSEAEFYAQELASNQRVLASMTAVSANATHELNTPLSSIALVVSELKNLVLSKSVVNQDEVLEDLKILEGEVQRCSDILSELCSSSGSILGQHPKSCTLNDLVAKALALLGVDETKVNVDIKTESAFVLQERPILVALKALIKNALDASQALEEACKVAVSVFESKGSLHFEVEDKGPGLSQELLDKIGAPFFSTKKEGLGLGLGAYIAKLVATELGGKLEYYSKVGVGTKACLVVPGRVEVPIFPTT